MDVIGCCALVGTGIVLSLLGSGGSMLSLPVLVYLFSVDIVLASSYSLFLIGTTSLVGAWVKHRHQSIDRTVAIIFTVCAIIGTFSVRRWIIPLVPNDVTIIGDVSLSKRAIILLLFACLAIASSLALLVKPDWVPDESDDRKTVYLVTVALITGLLVGFVGIGGGFIILPSLILFGRLPFKIAVATTLLIIGVNSTIGFIGDVINQPINWSFLLIATSLSIGGMILGELFGRRFDVRILRRSLGWLILAIAVGIVIVEWFSGIG
jgi:uncharacterized membrane protein YfcA